MLHISPATFCATEGQTDEHNEAVLTSQTCRKKHFLIIGSAFFCPNKGKRTADVLTSAAHQQRAPLLPPTTQSCSFLSFCLSLSGALPSPSSFYLPLLSLGFPSSTPYLPISLCPPHRWFTLTLSVELIPSRLS